MEKSYAIYEMQPYCEQEVYLITTVFLVFDILHPLAQNIYLKREGSHEAEHSRYENHILRGSVVA